MRLIKKYRDRKREKLKAGVSRAAGESVAPLHGYDFTPSFVRVGNRWGTLLSMTNKYPLNRENEFGWAVDLIPQITVPGVKSYLIEVDKLVSQEEQDEIMSEKVRKVANAHMEQITDSLDKNNKKREAEDQVELDKSRHRLIDLNNAAKLDATKNAIVNFKITLLLVADKPDSIVQQMPKLLDLYKEKLTGVEPLSFAGDQEERFVKLFDEPPGSIYDYTAMSSQFAGFDHAIRKGLNDAKGFPIGDLAESYSRGKAFMALNDSFKKKVIVAAPKKSRIKEYSSDRFPYTAASMWGQYIANDAMVNDHKVFHIVLNGFKYYSGKGSPFVCRRTIEDEIERIDLSKGGINPLQGFGNKEDVENIYKNLKQKVVQMVYLESKRTLNEEDQGFLNKQLHEFYVTRGLWDENVAKYPQRAGIVGIKNHASYPTLGEVLLPFKNSMTDALTEETGIKAKKYERAEHIYNILASAIESNEEIFNTHTTLDPDLGKRKSQIYYDLSGLRRQSNTLEAQFINVFDFCTYAAEQDDIVMIHGMDRLSLDTLQLIEDRLEVLEENGVRLAYIFDKIGSGDRKVEYPKADVFNTDGLLYTNIVSEFDYTIMGMMTTQEAIEYLNKINQPLTKQMQSYLTKQDIRQFQVRRPLDRTSNFIKADFMI